MRTLFILLLLTQYSVGFSQKRFTVKDPEIEFSYELPTQWQRYDDGYNLYLKPPTQNNDEIFLITYLETDRTDLEPLFDFTINKLLPINEPGFTLKEKGDEKVRELDAKWAIFDTKIDDVTYRNFLFFFIENSQIFKLRGVARTHNFEKYKDSFLTISKSIRSTTP